MNRLPVVLALAGALLATACDDQPTDPRPGQRPNALISDGATGGANQDVFFLPPLVPNPSQFFNAAFNPNVTTAVFQICPVSEPGGECAGAPIATFGNVAGATGPIVISSQDQHYLALWHTGQMNLADGLYQIQVFFDEPDPDEEPVAWADVRVVSSGRELRTIDNQTIGLLDGRTLPIKIRFETDCRTANCVSEVVTNAGNVDDPLILTSGDGALVFEPGWLPEGITAIRVTLQRHEPGPNSDCVGKAAYTGLGLVAQREACLEVTTDPVLEPGEETGIQKHAYIYVCKESAESDPYEEFLQIIKADDGRPLQALPDVPHGRLAELGFEPNCEPPIEIGFGSHPLLRLASRSLRAITRPVARLLEVKPLYAIDLGQGGEIGLFDGFSFFTLGVPASAEADPETPETATTGDIVTLRMAVTGLTSHPEGGGEPSSETGSEGLAGIDVRFTITAGNGSLSDGESGPVRLITVQTGSGEGAGIATVELTVGAGTNIVEAVALVDGDPVTLPVTFTVTGLSPLGSVVLSYSDPALPEDDDASTAGDVTSVQLVFNLVDGTYQATWNADPARPFNGNLRLNLNLGNTRLGGDLLPLAGIFSNVNSQTQLSYTGTAAALTTWLVGDIIASTGASPQFATDFSSGLVDLDDIALSNRDLLQQTLAEIIPR